MSVRRTANSRVLTYLFNKAFKAFFCKESTNKESCHSLSSVVEEVPLLVWTSVEDVMLLIFLFFSALVVTSVAVS